MNTKIEAFLHQSTAWRQEMQTLRAIILRCGLSEEFKWGKPCFTYKNNNVAIIQPFKAHCGLMFFKGSLLNDPERLLEAPGPNSHSAKRLMFSSVAEIEKSQPSLLKFVAAAIALEDSGAKVPDQKKPAPPPAELEAAFRQVTGLKQAFTALTPGRQRAYILHFSSAKQSQTRASRIKKHLARILERKGLND